MNNKFPKELPILIKGAGEMASAIAVHLYKAGYIHICMTELHRPLAISRQACFSEALFKPVKTVNGVRARSVSQSRPIISSTWISGYIAIVEDPTADIIDQIAPEIIIDARNLKSVDDTSISDAALVIGCGDAFKEGIHCHHRIAPAEKTSSIDKSSTDSVTKMKDKVLLWAEKDGTFNSLKKIGDTVKKNEVIALIDDTEILSPIKGIINSILRNKTSVTKGTRVAELIKNETGGSYTIRPRWIPVTEDVLKTVEDYILNR